MTEILQKINQLCDIENITITFLEKKIGASKGVLSRALAKGTDIQAKWLIAIVENYPRMAELLFNVKNTAAESEEKLIPVYDVYATAGRNFGAVTDYPVEYIDPGDLFRDATGVIRIYGPSMGDGYQSGSFVPYRELNNKMLVVPGEDYIIQTSEYRVLKTVRKSKLENHILAVSINDDVYDKGELAGQLIHEPFDINWNDIISIHLSLGNVRRNQNTTINGRK